MANENVMELTRPGSLDEEDDDDLDETLTERLLGLTEMFPESVQKVFGHAVGLSFTALKSGYGLARTVLWIGASSATILVLPVVFESERAQQQEQQLQQQRQIHHYLIQDQSMPLEVRTVQVRILKQILLGPNAAVSGTGSQNLLPGMGMMPPGMAPPK